MTTVGLDAFTRADSAVTLGSATTGGAWTAQAGTWGIASNRGYCVTGVGFDYATAVLATAMSNGTVEVTLSTVGNSGNSGIVIRSNSSTTGFAVLSDGMWDLNTDLQVGSSYTFANGDRMRVVMSGTSIEVFKQVGAVGAYSSVMATTSSAHQTNTKHGLTIWGTVANDARFDDFLIEDVTTTVAAVPATATAMARVPLVSDGSASYFPDTKVEVAFDSGYVTPVGSRTWTDVSQWVELSRGITISHGRADEFGSTEANRLTLTLDNSDGRFTADKTDGAYYPDVKIGRPIRVTTTDDGVDYVRFVGYVDEWPVGWNGSSNYAEAQVTASSRMARLGFDAELRSTITEEYLHASGDAPLHYWPLQEAQGATAAADIMGGPSLQFVGWGETPEFGAAMGLPGDPSATGAFFGETGTQWLRATLPTPVSTAFPNIVSIEGFVAGADAINKPFLVLETDLGDSGPLMVVQAVDDVGQVLYYDGTNFTAVAFDGAVDGSFPYHLAGTLELSATGTVTLSLWVNGELINTEATPGLVSASFTRFRMDVDDTSQQMRSTLAHVAVNADPTRIAERAASGVTGFGGEPAGDRIERYAGYANIAAAEVDADDETQPVGVVETANTGALEAMRRVEATESGVLFDARDNDLTFHGRARRYNTSAGLTLDAATQQIEADISPKLDRSTLANDVTATTNEDGSSARAFDQTSIDEYGFARLTLDIAGNNDAGFQAATWHVAQYSQPRPRIESLSVDLLPLSTSLRADVLNADISTRLALTGLPTQAPASSIDFFIEGYTETIGRASYEFSFNISPTNDDLMTVWQLEDATYGEIDDLPLAY